MIYQCITNVWSPKIGDPFLLAWIIAISYILVAFLTVLVARRAGDFYTEAGKARVFWLGLTVLLVFLGLNKQLDLQTFLRAVVKCLSILEGWYAQRREFQLDFVIAIAVVFGVFLVFIITFFREIIRKDRFGVAGIVFLLGFILIHASYFNYLNLSVVIAFYEAGLNWTLELTGIVLIGLQALIRLKPRHN